MASSNPFIKTIRYFFLTKGFKMDKFKIGDTVKIIKSNSAFYGVIGEINRQGNGTCWQVVFPYGIGVYFFENDLIKLKDKNVIN